ncbi:hypothetical protein PENTCL1PPCAC_28199, partial [Pristionchus entomophagus]
MPSNSFLRSDSTVVNVVQEYSGVTLMNLQTLVVEEKCAGTRVVRRSSREATFSCLIRPVETSFSVMNLMFMEFHDLLLKVWKISSSGFSLSSFTRSLFFSSNSGFLCLSAFKIAASLAVTFISVLSPPFGSTAGDSGTFFLSSAFSHSFLTPPFGEAVLEEVSDAQLGGGD